MREEGVLSSYGRSMFFQNKSWTNAWKIGKEIPHRATRSLTVMSRSCHVNSAFVNNANCLQCALVHPKRLTVIEPHSTLAHVSGSHSL